VDALHQLVASEHAARLHSVLGPPHASQLGGLMLPRRQPGAGGASELPSLASVAILLAAKEPCVQRIAVHCASLVAPACDQLHKNRGATPPAGQAAVCVASSLHKWGSHSGTANRKSHTDVGSFVFVHALRGLDAPTALMWVSACTRDVEGLVASLCGRGHRGAQQRHWGYAVIALCAALARLHPQHARTEFGQAARAAAKLGVWQVRRSALLLRARLRC
jgi:hypothetical protein